MALNLGFWGIPVLSLGALKVFTRGRARRRMVLAIARCAEGWVACNNRIHDLLLPTQWDIEGVEGIRYDGRYLIVSNHVSWVDIFVLFRAFHGHTAFLRFFLKQELIWLPIAGQACWALDFPFMKRYTQEYLKKHPEKRGTDLEATRRACHRYRTIPVAILNFIEGTRFTPEKHAAQSSPYRHLLRPRVGGIAFVIASMRDQLDAIFDVTLAYPGGDVTFRDFLCGRVSRITVRVRRLELPADALEKRVTDEGPLRQRFGAWIEGIWQEKDEALERLIGAT